MKSRSKIKKLAVIGDPIAHSLSPLFHNAALQKLKLPYEYRAIRVRPQDLEKFIRGRAQGLVGFNVTLPHKESILPLLDRLSLEAKLMGAVNTVVKKEDKLIGFNTDGAGYLRSLIQNKKFSPRGKNIVLLGAGGAARGLATALGLDQAKSIKIANRTLARAMELAKGLGKQIGKVSFSAMNLEGRELENALKSCHLLVNCTRVGLKGSAFADFPWKKLKRSALVSDIVYNPLLTPFLKAAKKHGHSIHTGEWMLVYQGALAFEMWTGAFPDVKLMHRVLLKELKKS